jgi:tetratricopeptide (TPR) repeat protein
VKKPDDSEPLHFEPTKAPAAKTTLAADPVKAQEFFGLGASFYEQGRYPEAVQNFHYAIQQQEDLWQAYQYMGACYHAQGMVNEAQGAYERMLQLNQDPALRAWVEAWKSQVGLPAGQAEAV